MCRERAVCGAAGAGVLRWDAGGRLGLWCVRVVSLRRLYAAQFGRAAAAQVWALLL